MGRTLKAELLEWTDIDAAQHSLSLSLGLMSPDISFAIQAKHVYWSQNPIGEFLYDMLMKLVELGVLEQETDPDDRVRWNPNYRGSWET